MNQQTTSLQSIPRLRSRRHSLHLVVIRCAIAIFSSGSLLHAETPPFSVWDSNDVEIETIPDGVTIRTTGSDPYIVWKRNPPAPASQRVVQFEYFCPDPIDHFHAFLGPPISEATRVELPDLILAEGWRSYAAPLRAQPSQHLPQQARFLRLDFGMRAGVRLQLRGLELREPNKQEQQREAERQRTHARKRAQASEIRDYLQTSFPLAWDAVTVTAETVRLSGGLAEPDQTLRLWEYPPSVGIEQSPQLAADIDLRAGRFEIHVPRRIEQRDRINSGWRISRQASDSPVFVSSRRFADSVEVVPGPIAATRAEPFSQKGLGGIDAKGPLEELPELGISAITVNLNVAAFLTSNANGSPLLDVGSDPPVYFRKEAFAVYDKLIDFARRHDIVVSAIVLIPRSKNPAQRTPLAHPESDGGIYAMPDLTTARGAGLYAAVIERIAARYRNTAEAPGGISNWILHNEIDFHPVWTNMGPQPRSLVTETYYRSMRLVHNIARSYNPHARVFVSLTHHWDVPQDESWTQLSPREVITTLQQYSRLEGDFAWGVAYHPYPQSLFAELAWKDTKPTETFDTPLITIQNLEVLGRFLHQPAMRDTHDRTRPVLLSEQGFHSADYSAEAQANQAGSLWYAMDKIEGFSWVESFHYHRWIDHPDEGGLKLGLRTLPTTEHPFGEKKLSWYVYQSIGTDAERELTRGLPHPGAVSSD